MIRSLTRLVVVAAVAAATTGCPAGGRDDDRLRTLRAQRIMSAPVAGTTDNGIEERPAGTAMGKSSRATLLRRLTLLPETAPDTALATAVDLARADGWAVDGGSPPPGGGWILRKPSMELGINVQERQLTITLVDTG